MSNADKLAETKRRRRDSAASPFSAPASCYVVNGGRGTTVVAGFPWFTDWGRDTFIAMRVPDKVGCANDRRLLLVFACREPRPLNSTGDTLLVEQGDTLDPTYPAADFAATARKPHLSAVSERLRR